MGGWPVDKVRPARGLPLIDSGGSAGGEWSRRLRIRLYRENPMRPGLLLLSPLLLAFAPAPKQVPVTDPDKAIEQFLKEAPALKKKGADALETGKKKLLEQLKKIKADLVKRGKKKEATAAGDRIVLAGVLDGEVTFGKMTPGALLKKAANGKY